MDALLDLLQGIGIESIHLQPVNKPWPDDPVFLEKAAAADIVIVNGEGSIHHSRPRAQRLAALGPYCRDVLRLPSILLNATLFANEPALYDDLRAFTAIAVRDRASAAELQRFGIANAIHAPDLSLRHELRGFRQPPGATPRIGFTDSIQKSTTEVLQRIGTERGYIDCNIRVARRMPGMIDSYAGLIGSLDLLLTGRYHAVCYAIGTMTPFVAIESNTNKISALAMDIFGSRRRLLSKRRLPDMNLVPYMRWSDEERAALDRFFAERGAMFTALGARIRTP